MSRDAWRIVVLKLGGVALGLCAAALLATFTQEQNTRRFADACHAAGGEVVRLDKEDTCGKQQ